MLIVLVQSLLFGQSTEGRACGFVTDRFGEPLAGASVEAAGTERRATADGNGKYCVTGLSAGEGELTATFQGFVRRQKTVMIVAGRASIADFALVAGRLSDPPTRELSGVVSGRGGAWIGGARVFAGSCLDLSVGSTVTSDERGKFAFELAEAGQYCIRVWKPGYRAAVAVVVVPSGIVPWSMNVKIRLERLGRGGK